MASILGFAPPTLVWPRRRVMRPAYPGTGGDTLAKLDGAKGLQDMKGRSNLLGEYLRARRNQVVPTEVGLEALGPRRVSGLRREEVAILAGISVDYYLRLEQGRDKHPSVQVLESLARALRLDETATTHLLALGSPHAVPSRCASRDMAVGGSVRQLLAALDLPAFVQDKHLDVLESNRAARAMSPSLVAGRNRLIDLFLDVDERALFVDWREVVAEVVAAFRASVGGDAGDHRTAKLVAELSAGDKVFVELWSRHDVTNRVDRPPVRLAHPSVGELTLTRDNLAIDGQDGLRLVVYHAEPGSESFDKLRRLTS